ncbi:glycoside hydrolase family 88 protein, partial [bacterium]|nr:glycoside hydrolase family 88 protein [bacterium]
CGQTYAELDVFVPDPAHLADITTSVLGMVESPECDDWWWCDALFMAMPVFMRLGLLHGDDRCFLKLHDLYAHTRTARGLYDPARHLWYRDESYLPPYATPAGAPCFWSRGNGWVFTGLARTLADLPPGDPHRAEYVATFRDMAAALAAVQRADGFWNVSLADTTDFPGPETSGTAFFTFGLAWGIRSGLLDEQTYLPVAARAWQGLSTVAVHPDGFLGYVQDVGGEPASSQPVTCDCTADFGVGAFLLAGSELFRLADGASAADEDPFVGPFLAQNAPNPFNPVTMIRFDLPAAAAVNLSVYDLCGRRIATLVDGELPPGAHACVWRGVDGEGRPAASGIYVGRLVADGVRVSRRMTLAR